MSRAQRSLWILTTATILFAGTLAQALAAQATTAADIVVSVSAVGLTVIPEGAGPCQGVV